jgi:hypothetical protein
MTAEAKLPPFATRLTGFKDRLIVDSTTGELAVKDQLLINLSATPVPFQHQNVTGLGKRIADTLQALKVPSRPLTTVFAGLSNPGHFEDVVIFQVTPPAGQTVFSITNRLRATALGNAAPGTVSPNHVMVPAPNGDWCPHGPPSPLATVPVHSPLGSEPVDITVIDSGYIWAPPSPGGPWGANGSPSDNPLYDVCADVVVHEAQWLQVSPGPNNTTTAQWVNGTPNVVDANGDGKLDALAGHANFVAGLIGQHCSDATVHIWNHNSGFSYKPGAFDNFSTEAAICRSLVMSQLAKRTHVIQIGHETTVAKGIWSLVWDLAFSRIGYKRVLKNDVVITAPAGNQGVTNLRIPAGLHTKYSFVKGVASVNDQGTRSTFSNYGPWVTCAARGEKVESTFLYVNMAVEENANTSTGALPPPRNFSQTSWAVWNGTSFAAPKVAGEVAARLSPSANAAQAWTSLMTCSGTSCPTGAGLGVIFNF